MRTLISPDDRTLRRRRAWFMTTAGLCILGTPAASAQEAPTSQTREVPANEAQATNVGQVVDSTAGEVVVTAQRRAETQNKVPISIATYTRDLMDREGIRRIDDIARLTPALRFTQTTGVTGNNGSNITIRGVASDVGSSTTALYIDDTPIQIRNVGYFGGNPYPRARGITEDEAVAEHASEYALRRISTADDVAAACLFLGSDVSRQITGVDLPIDGGWAAL